MKQKSERLPFQFSNWKPFLYIVALLVLILAGVSGGQAVTAATSANGLVNGDFENGKQGWTAKIATFNTATPAHSGNAAAQLKTSKKTGRAQFFQSNITLQSGATYELTFWAKSPSGKDLDVSLYKQTSAKTSYGLKNRTFALTSNWQQFTVSFTTSGFNGTTSDGRLRFRMPKGQNIEFSIDDVSLTTSDAPPPGGGGDDDEMLIYDFNGLVTESYGGFVMNKPPLENGDWTKPVNFAEGTMYFRAEVRGIPQNQPGMKLGWCFWQGQRENCKGNDVAGVPGTLVMWEADIKSMWKKNGLPIIWSEPRTKNGFAIRNSKNDPVSDKAGWNWNGENPDHWYPLDIRFTVVVVAKDGDFSGWDNYID